MTRLRTRLERLEREIDVEARGEGQDDRPVRIYIPDNGRGAPKSVDPRVVIYTPETRGNHGPRA